MPEPPSVNVQARTLSDAALDVHKPILTSPLTPSRPFPTRVIGAVATIGDQKRQSEEHHDTHITTATDSNAPELPHRLGSGARGELQLNFHTYLPQ